jgi:hypothetical protein
VLIGLARRIGFEPQSEPLFDKIFFNQLIDGGVLLSGLSEISRDQIAPAHLKEIIRSDRFEDEDLYRVFRLFPGVGQVAREILQEVGSTPLEFDEARSFFENLDTSYDSREATPDQRVKFRANLMIYFGDSRFSSYLDQEK